MCAMGEPWHVRRVRFAYVLAVAGVLLCGAAARPAWADTPGASLTFLASAGPPSASIVMTFDYPALILCPNLTVNFTWDGTSRMLARSALAGPGCSASASAVPPADL